MGLAQHVRVRLPMVLPEGAPVHPQTRSRATARAPAIAASAFSTSSASVATSRETVGSEAATPNSPGCARSTPISHAVSPPSATINARSNTILPGSCTADGPLPGPAPGTTTFILHSRSASLHGRSGS